MDGDGQQVQQQGSRDEVARLRRLTALAARLSASQELQSVVDAVLSAAVLELKADRVAVMRLDDGDGRLEIVGSRGLDPSLEQRYASVGIEEPLPASEALRTGELVVIATEEERDRRYPAFRGAPTSQTMVQVPLRPHDGPPVGVISIGFLRARQLDEATRHFIEGLGHLCGIAMARAELHEARERALERQSFLAAAGPALAGSLDPEDVVERVARLAVPALADACSICLAEGEELRPVAVAHAHPDQQAIVERLAARQPRITSPELLRVFADGTPTLWDAVPADAHLAGQDDEHRALLKALGVTAGLAVPLTAGSRRIGLLVLMMTGSARRLTAEDLRFAEDVAARAALAIDNAQLHAWQARQVEGLQGALDSRVTIEQAKGFLAAHWMTTPQAVFEPLRSHARRHRRSLYDVATDVLARRLPPDDLVDGRPQA